MAAKVAEKLSKPLTDSERVAQLEAEVAQMRKEWDAYKKVSPFYAQTQLPKLHPQKANRR